MHYKGINGQNMVDYISNEIEDNLGKYELLNKLNNMSRFYRNESCICFMYIICIMNSLEIVLKNK